MTFRLIHTSDWHLGQLLFDYPRDDEHDAFLTWLLDRIEEENVDVLLITGDIFDAANPSAASLKRWYRFLTEAGRRQKGLQIVAIAGNHDSPGRLEAPKEVLESIEVYVVGSVPRREDGELDLGAVIIPLRDRDTQTQAWLAAVPYLRPSDLPQIEEQPQADSLTQRVRELYGRATKAARARREPGQAVVVTGHLYAVGGEVSRLSERHIFIGEEHAVSADAFDADIAYVALGHLHKPQTVGGSNRIRYAGAPIPLSLSEQGYTHQVVLVELEGANPARTRSLRIPRHVDLIRIPLEGVAPPEDVLAAIRRLPAAKTPAGNGDRRPYVEVWVDLEGSRPTLRREIEDALAGRNGRLCRIEVQHKSAAAPGALVRSLAEVDPAELFKAKWTQETGTAPPEHVCAAFRELLEEAESLETE